MLVDNGGSSSYRDSGDEAEHLCLRGLLSCPFMHSSPLTSFPFPGFLAKRIPAGGNMVEDASLCCVQ